MQIILIKTKSITCEMLSLGKGINVAFKNVINYLSRVKCVHCTKFLITLINRIWILGNWGKLTSVACLMKELVI